MSVCICVGSCTSETTFQNFNQFSLHTACGHGSVVLCNTSCTSGFVDDAMLSHGNLTRTWWNVMLEVTRQGAASGAKSAVYDCLYAYIHLCTIIVGARCTVWVIPKYIGVTNKDIGLSAAIGVQNRDVMAGDAGERQKLVHCCNWLLTETQCKIISVQHRN